MLGWSYAKWAGAIAENPEIMPEELSKIICDSLLEKASYINETPNETLTLSFIDLEKLPKLKKSFNKMVSELSKAMAYINKLSKIYTALEKTESYGAVFDRRRF